MQPGQYQFIDSNSTRTVNQRTISEILKNENAIKKIDKSIKKHVLLGAVFSLIFSSVIIGTLTPYGPQGFSALESLQGAKGGATGLANAALIANFSVLGIILPAVLIAGTGISMAFKFKNKQKLKKQIKKIKNENQQIPDSQFPISFHPTVASPNQVNDKGRVDGCRPDVSPADPSGYSATTNAARQSQNQHQFQ